MAISATNIKRRFQRFGKNFKTFSKNWMGVVGLTLLLLVLLLAIIGPNATNYDIDSLTGPDRLEPPSRDHFLGTTIFGQDVFTILLASLRISSAVGVIAGSLTVFMGTTIGVMSAYIGGWFDVIVMRLTDVILVMPALPLMLVLSSLPLLWEQTHWTVMPIVYVLVFWPVSAKLIRSQALSLKHRTFVTSAKAAGAKDFYIIFRHVLPNVFPLMITMIITSMRQAILYESFLAYLGLGDPTAFTLGNMLHEAQVRAAFASGRYWLFFPPGIAIGFITLSFAFIGMAFDEIVNPRLRKR